MKKIFVLLCSLVLCISFAACDGGKPSVTDDGNDTSNIMPETVDPANVSTAPVATAEPDTEAPVTTDAPVTADTSPSVTDTPVTEPHVEGKELGSGFVISDSGTKLNLLLNWTAVNGKEEGTVEITVKLFLECYSIFVGGRDDGEIRIGETLVNYTTPQMELPGTGFNEIDFGTYKFTVKKDSGSSTTVPVYASWHFRGTYAGVPVEWITVNSTFTFDN